MKSAVFERAVLEARNGIREIDAEIDRLKAHRELLEVFETLSRQLLTVVPMGADPAALPGPAAKKSDPPAPPPPSTGGTLPNRESTSPREHEPPAESPSGSSPDAPAAGQPLPLDPSPSASNLYSLPSEERPASLSIDWEKLRKLI